MHQDLATLKAGGYRTAGLTKLKLTESLEESGFPREIFDLGGTLELLDLSGTGLAALPADFGERLPHLRIAFFSHCRFARFPAEALAQAPKLEMVAFRRNGMVDLPSEAFGSTSSPSSTSSTSSTSFGGRLRWLILTDNRLSVLPPTIGLCTRLEKCMLAGNRLATLPDSMAACRNLTLLRLAANRLPDLPRWLFSMPRLAFLSFAGNPCSSRAPTPAAATTPALSSSKTSSVSSSAVASRLASAQPSARPSASSTPLPHVDWNQIEIHHVLGEGASGIISKGTVKGGGISGESTPRSDASSSAPPPPPAEDVAIKIFRGALTSDGTPYDEMAACIAAGRHVNLVRVHGHVRFTEEEEEQEEKDVEEEEAIAEEVVARAHAAEAAEAAEKKDNDDDPSAPAKPFKGGLVMELIPPHYRVLGQPPSFDTCTRDNFDAESTTAKMPVATALSILEGVASAAEHLHARGIAHGDLYAHNILVRRGSTTTPASQGKTHAILSDFGAATLYGAPDDGDGENDEDRFPHLEKLEVLAFAHLVEDVLGLMEEPKAAGEADLATVARQTLAKIHAACTVETVASRPTFASIVGDLAALQDAARSATA